MKECTSKEWYIYEIHLKYDYRCISNAGGRYGYFFLVLRYTAIFAPTNPLEPAFQSAMFLDSGTEQRVRHYKIMTEEGDVCLILKKKRSSAFSFLNKVFNSIYYKNIGLDIVQCTVQYLLSSF